MEDDYNVSFDALQRRKSQGEKIPLKGTVF